MDLDQFENESYDLLARHYGWERIVRNLEEHGHRIDRRGEMVVNGRFHDCLNDDCDLKVEVTGGGISVFNMLPTPGALQSYGVFPSCPQHQDQYGETLDRGQEGPLQ